MEFNHIKEIIDQLKALDLNVASNPEIKALLQNLMPVPMPIVSLNSGTRIVRCRTVSVTLKEPAVNNRIFCTYAEFANPKRKSFLTIGRANSEDKSVFYGSIETKILNAFQTAAFELLPTTQEEEQLKQLEFRRLDLVAGIWEIQKPLMIVILGNLAENYINLNELGRHRSEMMRSFLEQNPNNADVVRLIDEFLSHEFSKDVAKGEEYNYKISANYIDLLQELTGFRGVVYPSTKALGAGNNIVIFPKYVRNKYVKLVHGVYSIAYNRENSCVNEFPMKGEYFNGRIRWKDSPDGKIPSQMRKYYLGLTNDDTFKKYIPMVDLSQPLPSKSNGGKN